MPRPVRPTRLLAPLLAATLVTCSDGIGPVARDDWLLVTSCETPEFALFDGRTGNTLRRMSFPPPRLYRVLTLSPDASTLYLSTASELTALDLPSLAVEWQEAWSDSSDRRLDRWDGVAVYGGRVAVSPDGTRLLLTSAYRHDTSGIAVLDARTRDLVAFIEPMSPVGAKIVTIPPSASSPDGRLLVFSSRQLRVPQVDSMYTLDPATLRITDSTATGSVPPEVFHLIRTVVLAPDRQHLYWIAYREPLTGFTATLQLQRYDLRSGQVVDSFSLGNSSTTWFAVTDRSVLLLWYSWMRTAPTMLYGLTPDLAVRDSAALPNVDDQPFIGSGIARSPDGTRVYITGGTTSQTFDVPAQHGSLLAVDPISLRVDWSHPPGLWCPSPIAW